MNGILVKVGGEQLILLVLAFLAVLAKLGGVFWISWLGLVVVCPVGLKWRRCRLATGVD